METIDKYSEYLTTYDQILDVVSFLIGEIERRRKALFVGRTDGFIRLYNKALLAS